MVYHTFVEMVFVLLLGVGIGRPASLEIRGLYLNFSHGSETFI